MSSAPRAIFSAGQKLLEGPFHESLEGGARQPAQVMLNALEVAVVSEVLFAGVAVSV